MAAFAVAFIGSLPAEGSGTAYQRMSLRWTRFEGAIAINPRAACGRRARDSDGTAGQGLGESNREPVSPAGLELENATVFLQPVADHLEALEQYHGAAADLLAGATAAMEAAYAMTRRGGAVVVAGLPDPQQKFVIPPVAAFVADERAVVGSYMGSCVPQRDVPRFMGLYRRGRLPVNRLRSGTVTLATIRLTKDSTVSRAVRRSGIW